MGEKLSDSIFVLDILSGRTPKVKMEVVIIKILIWNFNNKDLLIILYGVFNKLTTINCEHRILIANQHCWRNKSDTN